MLDPHPGKPCVFLLREAALRKCRIGRHTFFRLIREGHICTRRDPPSTQVKVCIRAMRAYAASAKESKKSYVPRQDDDVPLDEAATMLGVDRKTVYNWINKGVPFDVPFRDKKLPYVVRQGRTARGQPCGYRFITKNDIAEVKAAMARAGMTRGDTAELLGVCRTTVDNIRERGELTDVSGRFRRGDVEALKAKRKPIDKGQRYYDDKQRAWMLGKHLCKVYGLYRRFVREQRNEAPPEQGGGGLHARLIPNPRTNGKFELVWVYLESDGAAAAAWAKNNPLTTWPGAKEAVCTAAAALAAATSDPPSAPAPAGSTNGTPATEPSERAAPSKVASSAPQVKPRWNAARRELRFGQVTCARYQKQAPHQELLLASFEELAWPDRIDDPLPNGKLRSTLWALNTKLKSTPLRFLSDGSGQGILWSARS